MITYGVGWILIAVFTVNAPSRSMMAPPMDPSYQIVQGGGAVGPEPITVAQGEVKRVKPNASAKVTLVNNEITIRAAVAELARQAGLEPVYDIENSELRRNIRVNIVNKPVMDGLGEVLKGTGLIAKFASDGVTIMIRGSEEKVENRGQAQEVTGIIKGRVVDSISGTAVSGVTLVVVGTRLSAVTGNDGTFKVTGVPIGAQSLTAKLLGYQSKTIRVVVAKGENATTAISLAQASTTLSEVVTTVTGQQRKLEIGNSIATLNVDSIKSIAPVSNLTDILENRVPGLTVQRAGGRPGDPARIRLRGSSSINNSNDVIVVVDGVRVESELNRFGAVSQAGTGTYMAASPIDQIDINNIEKIDVFKGPSAAAMYGSDAANGVIVITTKRGKAGPSKWTFSTDQGLSYIPGKFPEGTFRFGTAMGMAPVQCIVTDPEAGLCDIDSVVRYQALNDPYFDILGTGRGQQYSTTVSGGSANARFSITGSHSNDIGVVKMSDYLSDRFLRIYERDIPSWMKRPDKYNKMSLSNMFSLDIDRTLSIDITAKLYRDVQKRTSLGNGGISYFMTRFHSDTLTSSMDRFNESANRNSDKFTTAVNGRWNKFDWLPIQASIGLDRTADNDKAYLPRGIISMSSTPDSMGKFSVSKSQRTSITYTANSAIPFLSNKIITTVGINGITNTSEGFTARTTSLPPGVDEPTTGFTDVVRSENSRSINGWFLEPRLNFRSSLFASPGFRIDQNGLQGGKAGLMRLPKLNLSWLASEQDGITLPDVISLLRLRLAVGAAGVQPGIQDRLRLYRADTAADIPQQYLSNFMLSTIGNSRLKPERSTEYEWGGDLDLFDGRFGMEFTQYRKIRRDAIVSIPTAPSLSIGNSPISVHTNIGIIENNGNEVSVRGAIIERESMTLGGMLGFYMNANKVTKLSATSNVLYSLNSTNSSARTVSRVVAGYPLWGVWARPILGYSDTDNSGSISLGEVILGDSTVYLGQSEPKGTLNMSSYLTVLGGQISLNIEAGFTYGMSQIAEAMSQGNSPFVTSVNSEKATLLSQAIAASSVKTGYGLVQKVDTWRINSVSIRYMIPHNIVSRLNSRSASVSLQGSNVFMRSKYMGMDPNVNSRIYDNGHVADGGAVPQPRSWSIRFTIGN